MTFTFNLETNFKVTAQHLLKRTFYVKFELNRTKRRVYIWSEQEVSAWPDLTLTLDLETSF